MGIVLFIGTFLISLNFIESRVALLPQITPPEPEPLPSFLPPPNAPQDILTLQSIGSAVNGYEQFQKDMNSRSNAADDKKHYGPYVLTNQTLYEEYLLALGVDEKMVNKLMSEKPIITMEENPVFTRWMITTNKILPNSESRINFIEDMEFSEMTEDGRKCRSTVYREAATKLHEILKCEPNDTTSEISRIFDEKKLVVSLLFPYPDIRVSERVFKVIE